MKKYVWVKSAREVAEDSLTVVGVFNTYEAFEEEIDYLESLIDEYNKKEETEGWNSCMNYTKAGIPLEYNLYVKETLICKIGRAEILG